MKLGEIIARVQSLYSGGVASDDSRLSNRLIYNVLLSVRSLLISQQAKKKQRISQWNYQPISCIELISVPDNECPCVPTEGCTILRSKYKLPEPLSGLSGTLIQTVTTIDRGKKIDEMTLNATSSQKGNKYTSKKETYFIESGYLYISTPNSKLSIVRIVGLFEDPIKASRFKGFCDDCIECTECIDYQEEEFYIDNDLIKPLIELANQELIEQFSQMPHDNRNNTVDDNKPSK